MLPSKWLLRYIHRNLQTASLSTYSQDIYHATFKLLAFFDNPGIYTSQFWNCLIFNWRLRYTLQLSNCLCFKLFLSHKHALQLLNWLIHYCLSSVHYCEDRSRIHLFQAVLEIFILQLWIAFFLSATLYYLLGDFWDALQSYLYFWMYSVQILKRFFQNDSWNICTVIFKLLTF